MKTIQEMVIPAEFPADVQAGLEALDKVFSTSEIIARLDALSEQIAKVPLAKRFSRGRIITADTQSVQGDTPSPLWTGVSEAAFKQRELQGHVDELRRRLQLLCTHAKDVYLEIEASQREFDS